MKFRLPPVPSLVLVAMFFSAGGYADRLEDSAPVPLQKELALLPQTVGRWAGEFSGRFASPFSQAGADVEVLRDYRRDTGEVLTLYIGYFQSQSQGKEIVHFSTDRLHRSSKNIALKTSPDLSFPANQARITQGKRTYDAIFWYEILGRQISGRKKAKVYSTFDNLIYGRTNGAVILVAVPDNPSGTGTDTLALVEDFLGAAYPIIEEFLAPTREHAFYLPSTR